MKTTKFGLAMSLGIMAIAAQAEQIITIDGTDYPMSELLAVCQGMADNPTGQIACFSNVARLLEEQSGSAQQATVSATQALDALRSVAQYEDEEGGLMISGSGCDIQLLYYNNYFHISRRNVSAIDIFSAKFDASNVEFDQIVQTQGGQTPLSKGVLSAGAIAVTQGNAGLESGQNNFAPRSAGLPLDVYAAEVVDQLPATESQTFDFVLVHPQRSGFSTGIWNAFEAYVNACRS